MESKEQFPRLFPDFHMHAHTRAHTHMCIYICTCTHAYRSITAGVLVLVQAHMELTDQRDACASMCQPDVPGVFPPERCPLASAPASPA